jgi:hypothetical protein
MIKRRWLHLSPGLLLGSIALVVAVGNTAVAGPVSNLVLQETCSADMVMGFNRLCYERGLRGKNHWYTAADQCFRAGRRLPTVDELLNLNLIGQARDGWTSNLTRGPTGAINAFLLTGGALTSTDAGQNHLWKCVAPPRVTLSNNL